MTITKGLASSPVQAAIYTLLSAAPSITALVGDRIYDAVPTGVTDPYIVIAGLSEDSDDTLEDGDAGIGSALSFTIEAYSDDQKAGAGFKTVQNIASAVKVLLHEQPLTVAGWTLVLCQHETTDFLPDQDEVGRMKRRAISTYSVSVEG